MFGIFNLVGIASNTILNAASVVFSEIILRLAAWFLSLCGTLLNVAMYFTTHLGMFIDASPVIFSVWQTIRDISSMLLIFFILWAAIQMILDLKSPNYGDMIKNLIIVGVLINFSFFFTRVLIDTSNIVSLQFYNAIAPANTASVCPQATSNGSATPTCSVGTITSSLLTAGGISDIMMKSLRVTAWYNGGGAIKDNSVSVGNTSLGNTLGTSNTKSDDGASTKWINIMLITFGGTIVMVVVGISFLVVALACIWRLVVLIFLLAFSPVWIAAYAVPSLKDASKLWTDQLKSNLVFLPVYLGLTYVALKIVIDSHLNDVSSSPAGLASFINLFVGFAIIIFMLTLPIATALKISGGNSLSWTNDMFSNMKGWAKNKALAPARLAGTGVKLGAGVAARATVGKFASSLDKSLSKTTWGNKIIGRDLRAATLGAMANNKFGTKRSFKEVDTLQKDVVKKQKEIDNRKDFDSALDTSRPPVIGKTLNDTLKKMSPKEKLTLGAKNLKNSDVLKLLNDKDFDAIKNADESDISADEKSAIFAARKKTLLEAVDNGETDTIKHMAKNMNQDDFVSMAVNEKDRYGNAYIEDDNLLANITPSHLEKISREGLVTQDQKSFIGSRIRGWAASHGSPHRANSFIARAGREWS